MIRPARSRCALLAATALLAAACTPTRVGPPPAAPQPELRFESVGWAKLPGWQAERVGEAWPALLASCDAPRLDLSFAGICERALAQPRDDEAALRQFFEREFRPWRVLLAEKPRSRRLQRTGLITGYYEPVLRGSRRPEGAFRTPLYAVPEDLVTVDLGALYPALQGERIRGRLQGRRVAPFPNRAQLADGRVLAGKELVWVDDPVDAFFLQIQGSGRVQLTDGSTVRLAFADVNGHPYRAVGRYLVEQGELTVEQATATGIRAWLKNHPERLAEVLNHNPSVVFFREEPLADPATGPRGSLGVPLTAGRSIAIDPRWLPLGAPMYLATTWPAAGPPLQRLVLAQDTGGAIRGGIRADLFWGLGDEAGERAGRMRETGELWLLWPADQPPPARPGTPPAK